jgi:hypothetical protein
MNETERLDAVMVLVLALTLVFVGARATLALSFPEFGFGGRDPVTWWLALRIFNIRIEVLALGAVAYVLPHGRLNAVARRVAAVLAAVGIAAQVAAWILEFGPSVHLSTRDAFGSSLMHVANLVAFGGVFALWFVSERGRASDEIAAADLP